MNDPALEERAAAERLVRERFIWRFRFAAVVFMTLQTLAAPGDHLVLSAINTTAFWSSVLVPGLLLRGRPGARAVRWIGALTMAFDVAVVAAVMVNNLTDPSEPIYLVTVLAMLEATVRWRGRGGLLAGVVAGCAAGAWTLAVSQRSVGSLNLDHATMRAGTIIALGVFLGSLVRRMSDQHDRLQGILDTTQDLMVVIDLEGTILSVNAACRPMLGYAPDELVGRQYRDFFHPDDVRTGRHSQLEPPTDRPVLHERRVICRDGSVRCLELNAVAVPGASTIHVSARDVTDRLDARRRLEESEQRFRSLFEHNTDAVYAMDLDGRFTMVNPATEDLTGYSADELIGSSFEGLIHPEDLERCLARFERAVSGAPQEYELRILDRRGRGLDLDVTNSPIVVDGDIVGVFGVAKDVTDRRRLERELGHQATHDALTGLPNRFNLEAAIEAATDGLGADRTLLFIDLDRFKLVNDSLGHRTGDEVLVVAVERLRGSVRSGDLLARWAGDEFCVLLAEGTDPETALTIADRLRSVLAEPFHVGGREVRLSASIGVARSEDGSGERLVQIADQAMYAAKRGGRDRISVYVPGVDGLGITQIDLEVELRHAIDRRGLVLHYQPIVDACAGRIVGVEALVRWPRPDGSLRPPVEFVPLAEECGLIRAITRLVVDEVCQQLAGWDRDLGLSRTLQGWVNVSITDLETPAFADEVGAAVRRAGITAGRLVLEVTETTLMRDVEQVSRTVAALRRAGVSLAIDDFGTGYSTMSQLDRLEVTACKIDRGFVAGAPEHARDAAVLQALVDVGTAFGLPVVAEGVERPEELAAVQATGCPLVQGFLLAAPAPPEALAELLAAGSLVLPGAVRSGR